MIIKLVFQNQGMIALMNRDKNGMPKNNYIRFSVDEYSIEEAIQAVKKNKWIVALDYVGDIEYLKNIVDIPKVPLIVMRKVEEVTKEEVELLLKQVPVWVRLVIKTDVSFSDMRLIKEISAKYSNVRFCGGSFLRLPGCNIGCVCREDLKCEVPETKVKYYTHGCACIKTTMKYEDTEDVDIVNIVETQEVKNKVKSVNTLEDLLMY